MQSMYESLVLIKTLVPWLASYIRLLMLSRVQGSDSRVLIMMITKSADDADSEPSRPLVASNSDRLKSREKNRECKMSSIPGQVKEVKIETVVPKSFYNPDIAKQALILGLVMSEKKL